LAGEETQRRGTKVIWVWRLQLQVSVIHKLLV